VPSRKAWLESVELVEEVEDQHAADMTALRKHVDEEDKATRATLSVVQRTVWMDLGGVLVIATVGGWLLQTLVP
jgi:hypothetical protein